MVYVLGTGFKVKDYVAWKADFDDYKAGRRESGQGDYRIFHTPDDPNNLVLLVEWDSLENAKTFMESSKLRELEHESHVTDPGETFYLVEVDEGTLD